MTNQDLFFRVLFTWSQQKNMVLTDLTDYAGLTPVVDPLDVTGYIKVSTPIGVIHNNLVATKDVGTVDIFPDASTDSEAIALPLTQLGRIYPGLYEFTYQSRVWKQMSVFTISAIAASTNSIFITGDVTADIHPNLGKYFRLEGTPLDGQITPISAVYDSVSGLTEIVVNETMVDYGSGDFVTYDSYDDYTTSQSYEYLFEEPVVDIQISSDCFTSRIVSKDMTDYNLVTGNTIYTPTQKILSHKVTPPAGSGFPTPSVFTTSVVTLGPNIWTQEWISEVEADLLYNITTPTWKGLTWFYINMVVEGKAMHEVQCTNCMCNVYECIKSIRDKYFAAKEAKNYARSGDLKMLLENIQRELIMFWIAERCGKSPDEYCKKIVEYINYEQCYCDTTAGRDVSKEIIPLANVLFGFDSTYETDNNQIFTGAGIPLSVLGKDGDLYLDIDSGDVYHKINSVWVVQTNMIGPSGPSGPSGADSVVPGPSGPSGADSVVPGPSGPSGPSGVDSTVPGPSGPSGPSGAANDSTFQKIAYGGDQEACNATVTWQLLKSIAVPADTMIYDGDDIILEMFLSHIGTTGLINIKGGLSSLISGGVYMFEESLEPAGNSGVANLRLQISLKDNTPSPPELNYTSSLEWYWDSNFEKYMSSIATQNVDISVLDSLDLYVQTIDGAAGDIKLEQFHVYVINRP